MTKTSIERRSRSCWTYEGISTVPCTTNTFCS